MLPTNLGEGRIGERSRVVRRKVGKVVIPIVAPRTGLPRALVLEAVPEAERRLVVRSRQSRVHVPENAANRRSCDFFGEGSFFFACKG